MPASVKDDLPSTSKRIVVEEEEEDMEKMAARLQALRSWKKFTILFFIFILSDRWYHGNWKWNHDIYLLG